MYGSQLGQPRCHLGFTHAIVYGPATTSFFFRSTGVSVYIVSLLFVSLSTCSDRRDRDEHILTWLAVSCACVSHSLGHPHTTQSVSHSDSVTASRVSLTPVSAAAVLRSTQAYKCKHYVSNQNKLMLHTYHLKVVVD